MEQEVVVTESTAYSSRMLVKISAEKAQTPVQCNVLLLHPATPKCQAAVFYPQLYRHL